MPRAVLMVTLALCAVAAGLGVFLGTRPLVTETQVIEAGAAMYVKETGGTARDCIGVPGNGQVWIEVRCGESSELRTYLFDRGGRLIVPEEVRT